MMNYRYLWPLDASLRKYQVYRHTAEVDMASFCEMVRSYASISTIGWRTCIRLVQMGTQSIHVGRAWRHADVRFQIFSSEPNGRNRTGMM